MRSLEDVLTQTPYVSYPYSYPHKTAYRPANPPVALRKLWRTESRGALFLYFHIPFCEMRCGYCNLFTLAGPQAALEAAYLDTLERQARRVRSALGTAKIARLAVGGGTPTYLNTGSLRRLFEDIAGRILGISFGQIPISVEVSPATITPEKLKLLHEHGVDRVSIGVQSFIETEVRAVGRVQPANTVTRALDLIKNAGLPVLNIDLIYGLPGQTLESWATSLQAALQFAPEELYLYPLYVRPLTGMDRRGKTWDDVRLAFYRAGHDLLLDAGYTQVSMRMFRAGHAPTQDGPVYCCQEDGMVGLGCGARSYTRAFHYASEYAVGRAGIREILSAYIDQPDGAFGFANNGFHLDEEDQHRRYVIKTLFLAKGLSYADYRRWFGTCALDDLPELNALIQYGLAVDTGDRLKLTGAGMERTDALGPWLYSAKVHRLMEEYKLR